MNLLRVTEVFDTAIMIEIGVFFGMQVSAWAMQVVFPSNFQESSAGFLALGYWLYIAAAPLLVLGIAVGYYAMYIRTLRRSTRILFIAPSFLLGIILFPIIDSVAKSRYIS